jgi:quercetin dioxygenase-like cupin family protein
MINRIKPKHSVDYAGSKIEVYHANKGEGIPFHLHNHSHLTICMSGSCKLTQEEKSVITDKNSTPINLVADKMHEIEALEDNTVFVNVFFTKKEEIITK